MKKILIFEPEAKSSSGHYYHVAAGIRDALLSRGYEAKLFVNRSCSIFDEKSKNVFWMGYWRPNYVEALSIKLNKVLEIFINFFAPKNITYFGKISFLKIFWIKFYMRFENRIRLLTLRILILPIRVINRFFQISSPFAKYIDFRKTIRRYEKISGSDEILEIIIPTVGINEVVACKKILRKHPNLRFHLIIRAVFHEPLNSLDLGHFADEFKKSGLGAELVKVQNLINNKYISLYTDTSELQNLLQNSSGLPFNVTGVPTRSVNVKKGQDSKHLKISYLGDARTEKGFHYLPEIVKSSHENYYNIQIDGLNKGGREAYYAERLLNFDIIHNPNNNINLIYGTLDSPTYQSLLSESDVVILPYLHNNYRRRSSGIFFEAIQNHCIPVIPSGTTMSNLLMSLMHEWTLQRNLPVKKLKSTIISKTFKFNLSNLSPRNNYLFDFVMNEWYGQSVVVEINYLDSGYVEKYQINSTNKQDVGGFAIPLQHLKGKIQINLYGQDGKIFKLSEVKTIQYGNDINFLGFIYDNYLAIPKNLSVLSKYKAGSINAVKFFAARTKDSNSFEGLAFNFELNFCRNIN